MKKPGLTMLAVAGWLALTVTGTGWLLAYAGRSGVAGMAPAHWPAASRLLRVADRPTLVMFLHPRCPCSRASLGELAVLLAQRGVGVEARAVFFYPPGQSAEWSDTDLWRTAAAIPELGVERDEAGHEAQLFGAATSGDTLLYDASGRLLFHGGLTMARGHFGDNQGLSTVEALLRGETAAVATTRIFGCALFARHLPGASWKN